MSDASKNYPRGVPYRPPESFAEQEARMRHLMLILVTLTAVSLLATVGLGFYFVITMNRAGRVAANNLGGPQVTRDTPKAAPSVLANNPRRDQALEALGGLAAAHLYQSYLNIGLLADAMEEDPPIYKDADAKLLLDRIMEVIGTVDRQLFKLTETDLDPADQKALERTRELAALLLSQAKELRAYWNTGAKEHADKYQKLREEAFVGISDLLKIRQ